jgi:hypothetical protein
VKETETMSTVFHSAITTSFAFPDLADASPLTKDHPPRFFYQHGVEGVLRVDVPATQLCDIVKIILEGIKLLLMS